MVLQVMFPTMCKFPPEPKHEEHMVMTHDKWFNEKDGEQAVPSELSRSG